MGIIDDLYGPDTETDEQAARRRGRTPGGYTDTTPEHAAEIADTKKRMEDYQREQRAQAQIALVRQQTDKAVDASIRGAPDAEQSMLGKAISAGPELFAHGVDALPTKYQDVAGAAAAALPFGLGLPFALGGVVGTARAAALPFQMAEEGANQAQDKVTRAVRALVGDKGLEAAKSMPVLPGGMINPLYIGDVAHAANEVGALPFVAASKVREGADALIPYDETTTLGRIRKAGEDVAEVAVPLVAMHAAPQAAHDFSRGVRGQGVGVKPDAAQSVAGHIANLIGKGVGRVGAEITDASAPRLPDEIAKAARAQAAQGTGIGDLRGREASAVADVTRAQPQAGGAPIEGGMAGAGEADAMQAEAQKALADVQGERASAEAQIKARAAAIDKQIRPGMEKQAADEAAATEKQDILDSVNSTELSPKTLAREALHQEAQAVRDWNANPMGPPRPTDAQRAADFKSPADAMFAKDAADLARDETVKAQRAEAAKTAKVEAAKAEKAAAQAAKKAGKGIPTVAGVPVPVAPQAVTLPFDQAAEMAKGGAQVTWPFEQAAEAARAAPKVAMPFEAPKTSPDHVIGRFVGKKPNGKPHTVGGPNFSRFTIDKNADGTWTLDMHDEAGRHADAKFKTFEAAKKNAIDNGGVYEEGLDAFNKSAANNPLTAKGFDWDAATGRRTLRTDAKLAAEEVGAEAKKAAKNPLDLVKKAEAAPQANQPPGPVLAIGLHPAVQRLLGTPFTEHIANLKSWGRRLLGDAYDNPDLAEFSTDEAGYRMDHAAAKRRQWYRNATDIAGLRVNALVGKDIPEAYLMDTSENVPTLRALPNLYRNRALLRAGKNAGQGITDASNEAAIRFNEAGVPQQYRELFMSRYKAMNDALLAEERAAGVDVKQAEDYSHRIAMDHQEGKANGGSRYGAVADRSPGFAKETVGSSELDFEPDALRAFFVRNVAHEHLLASREMAGKIKDNPALNLNDQLRSGAVQWSKGDHAVYRFGEAGSPAGEMSDVVDSANAVKLALAKERTAQARGKPAPAPNAPLLDEQGKPIYVVPKQLARGLVKAGQAADMTNIAQVVRKITSKVQAAYLNFPLNYNYHATQIWQDSMSVLKNVLPQDAAPAVRAAFKAAKELAKDLEAVREGKMPTYLPEQLRRGLAGGRFETYMNEEVTNGHIVNDSMVPGRLRPISLKNAAGVTDAAGRAWVFSIENPENLVGLYRETVAKAALDEVYRNRMGATPNQAARMASQNMGNYGRRSKFAQNMSPIAVFLKYPAEALARVTIRMFDDPVTGKASMRGLVSGPVPKEIAIAAVTTMLTKLMTRNDEDDPAGNLPRVQAGVLGRAMVIGNPVTGKALRNDKGQLVTLDVDSYAEVMDSVYEHVKAVWDAVREGGLTPLQHQAGGDVRSMASHIAAPVRLPLELKYGIKAGSGAPVTSEQRAKMDTGKQAEDNRKTKGIGLSDAAVYALEQLGGPLTRTVEALRGESSTSGWNPFVKTVDPRQKMAEDTYEYGPEKYDQFANELDKGPAGDQEKINALLAWASKNPTLLKKWIADYRSGSRAYAKDAGQTVERRRENRLSRLPEPSGR